MRRMATALTLCAGFALPQAAAACAQLSAQVWMCDRGTPWEEATWDTVGDGSTRYLGEVILNFTQEWPCLLYTSPSPRDRTRSRMPSSA